MSSTGDADAALRNEPAQEAPPAQDVENEQQLVERPQSAENAAAGSDDDDQPPAEQKVSTDVLAALDFPGEP